MEKRATNPIKTKINVRSEKTNRNPKGVNANEKILSFESDQTANVHNLRSVHR